LLPKSLSGSALAFEVYPLMPSLVGVRSPSVPDGPRYQVRAVVPGTGYDEKERSNPGYGLPGVAVPVGDVPAPLSNNTLTAGSFSNASSAAWYVGIS
jgi:hypothetical protein